MEITFVGYFILPVGFYSMLFHPQLLVALLMFFVAFSATAIVNFPSIPFGLQPYHYLGILLVFRQFITSLKLPGFGLRKSQVTILFTQFLFWFIALLSYLRQPFTGDMVSKSAQLFHLGLGICVMTAMTQIINRYQDLGYIVGWYLRGGMFVILWGFFQFIAYSSEFRYPMEIFNNSVGAAAGGYASTTRFVDLLRVSSVATEPSFLARFLLSVIAIAALSFLKPRGHYKLGYFILIILAFISLLISNSATGYLGMLCLLLLILARQFANPRTYLFLILIAIVLAIGVSLFPQFVIAIEEATLEKFNSWSYYDRLRSVRYGFLRFEEAPVLGWGLGSITSHDLVAKLLSNTGFLGLSAYLGFLGLLGVSSYQHRLRLTNQVDLANSSSRNTLILAESVELSVIIMVIADVYAGFSYTYANLWILFGMLLGSLGVDFEGRRRGDKYVSQTTNVGHLV